MDIARPDLKAKAHKRRILIGVAVAAALAVGGIALARLPAAAPKVPRNSVWIDTVKRGEMLREVRGPGTLVPKEIRWIAAETSARVERIVIKPGATVEAGSVIIELSNPEVQDQLLAAKSAVTAAQADYSAKRMSLESQQLDQNATVAATEADYEGARLQAEAEGELNRKGIISALQYKQSQLKSDQFKIKLAIEKERATKFQQNLGAQLAAERTRIEQLNNTLALRQRQADALKVKAGIAGVLQRVPVEEGQQVTAGFNLARVAKPDVLMAELRIAETQAKDVRHGLKVKVDTRNGVVDGTVIRIDPAVQNGTVQVDVELDGELPPGARPDLSVDGTIEIERIADAVFVGRPAFGQPGANVSLFRLTADADIAQRVPVKLGRASVSVVEIVQGLKPGDQVILSDTSAWDTYERIKLN